MKRPNETRMALTGAKRNVETMRAVRDGRFAERSESGPAALPQRSLLRNTHEDFRT